MRCVQTDDALCKFRQHSHTLRLQNGNTTLTTQMTSHSIVSRLMARRHLWLSDSRKKPGSFSMRQVLTWSLLLTTSVALAQDTESEGVEADRPIRALLVTGGCCHDYARQKLILTRGISARANVVWTVAHQGGSTTNTEIPLYDDPEWYKGFDIVVHNECFAGVKDKEFVERIVQPHREGLPAILIHCAMHCYRTGDNQWFDFVGMQSPGHGPHYSYTVENLKPDHPIMKDFGPTFVAPKGELYHSIKLFDTATALGQANRKSDQTPQTCIWTNQYGKGRVFATTIGHYNETMAEPKYLDMITRGLLWACDKDADTHFQLTTEKQNQAIADLAAIKIEKPSSGSPTPVNCCGESNLAYQKPVTSKSVQDGNPRKHLTDGRLDTRWCASGSQVDEWVTVDLETPTEVKAMRLHWEKPTGVVYRYTVEASNDNESWETVVDASENRKAGGLQTHQVDIKSTRYLRVTFLGATPGLWGSLWEMEVSSGELAKLPKRTKTAQGPVASVVDVKAPDGFQVTMFGAPPEVNYPVCLTTAPTGEVFVGVDEQGSLGKSPDGGRVLRCIDTDGDGQADEINVFAKMDHPRGLIYDNGSLWVLHPPFLSVFHDHDRDGTADEQKTLLTGVSTDEVNKRGADHTTNGIRMGIDGWIYIAVGDFGFTEVKGTDGRVLARRGGGILRVRPDGTEMEIHNWGQRNILDVCIDPYMNIFTRDNTNDGGGWDIRLSHILQSGEYGYPSLYLNFTEESLPPLADYGGGSGCGGMFLHDLRWPDQFANTVYTCDWGRSEVYMHNLPSNGPTFDAHQEVFLKIPRPTDIDVDGSGRMYVSSWKNGKFNFSGPNVGFVAQVTPIDFVPKPFPNLNSASDSELIEYLAAPSAVYRLHSQLEILRRGRTLDRIDELTDLASDLEIPLYGRVAAIYTLRQIDPGGSDAILIKLTEDDSVREFALRALTDRESALDRLPLLPFVEALRDSNPRVRAQALISLGRLGRPEAGEAILPLTKRSENHPQPTAEPLYKQPDPGRVIPHLAVRALVNCKAYEACLAALNGPDAEGALWALRCMHTAGAVNGLAQKLSSIRNSETRRGIITALIRLYHREGDYKGGWWGTRPDRTGPYYDRQEWDASDQIATVLKTVMTEADEAMQKHVQQQLQRHKVEIDGLSAAAVAAVKEMQKPIEVPKLDPNNPNQIGNIDPEIAVYRATNAKGDPARGRELFKAQSCIACHTYADGQTPKGPHLVDIGKRSKPNELLESILTPSAKIAQGFDTYTFVLDSGKTTTGFVVGESADTVAIRLTTGVQQDLSKDSIDERVKQKISMMPKGLVNNLTPEQLADLLAYLQSLRSGKAQASYGSTP